MSARLGAGRGSAFLASLAAAALSLGHGESLAKGKPRARGALPAWLAGTPPAGWRENAALARSVGTGLVQSAPFGQLRALGGATAHVESGTGAFYVLWAWSEQPSPSPAETIRDALDRLRAKRTLSSPEARSTEELRYEESLEAGVAEARLEWRHVSNETLSLVRAFAWLNAEGKPRLAAAECVVSTSGGAAPPAADKACRDALASVAVNVPPANRGPLAALPASADPGRESDEAAAGGASGALPAPSGSQPTVGPVAPGSEGRVLYRGPEPKPERKGVSPWLIAAGAALILGSSYWTLRRRRRFEADRVETDPVEGSSSADPGGDDER